MNTGITEAMVDCLHVYSAHVLHHKAVSGVCEVMFVLTNDLLDHNVYSIATFFADGYVMCRSESEIDISPRARKRLRDITHFMAAKIVNKLRNNIV